jgi:putative endonuclease
MEENKKNSNIFWIYILECKNGNYYTGYTRNLDRRYQQHLKGTANSKYTKSFKPKRIARSWQLFENVGTVLKIERFIKRQRRTTKEALINSPEKLGQMLREKLNLFAEIHSFDHRKLKKHNNK